MSFSLVLEESRTPGKTVILEKLGSTEFNSKRFQVSVLTRQRFEDEETARAAYLKAKKGKKV